MRYAADERGLLRARMSELRDGLSAEYRAFSSQAIAGHVLESGMWRDARSVFLYCSFGSEVDTRALMTAALDSGKALYLPRCYKGRVMRLFRVNATDELKPGRFGIYEPDEGCEISGPPDLCLVPGLAFDIRGGRMGYGGGYYDVFLKANPDTKTAALAYTEQVIERVPVSAHDVPVANIITPAGIITCE